MATKLYPYGVNNLPARGTNDASATGTAFGWTAGGAPPTTNAVAGGTCVTIASNTTGIEISTGTNIGAEFLSPPLAADVTISGTITNNIWCNESDMSANAVPQVIVERLDSQLAIVSTVSDSKSITEASVTTNAVRNWTATPTSTNFLRGERIRIRLLAGNVGTMGGPFNFGFNFGGASGAGVDGDTWVQFTETLTFEDEAATPGGSTIYLTNTTGPAVGANIEKEAWTARGAGVQTGTASTVAGYTAPILVGTLEWYTRPLAAFTLGGLADINVRGQVSTSTSRAALRCEIAVCNGDGSSPVVWGAGSAIAQLTTTEVAYSVSVAGDDVAVTDGQRLRIRVYIDDCINAMVTGRTATLYYAGTSAAASGDTYVILPQTVTEYSATPSAAPRLTMAPMIAGR